MGELNMIRSPQGLFAVDNHQEKLSIRNPKRKEVWHMPSKKEDTERALSALSGLVGYPIAALLLGIIRTSILAQQGLAKAITWLIEAVRNENSD
jgi:hypothetical protein